MKPDYFPHCLTLTSNAINYTYQISKAGNTFSPIQHSFDYITVY